MHTRYTPWLAAGALAVLVVGCAPPAQRRTGEAPTHAEMQHRARPAAASQDELPALGEDSTLDDYLAYAALENPGLEAAFNDWQAAAERVPQAKALPDPVLSYELWGFSDSQMHMATVNQTFPWFGKLDLRATVARKEAEAAHRRYEDRRLRLLYDVKNTYYEYYYLGRAIAVVRENRDLLASLETVLRTRYAAAAADYADVIRAQVELGKLDDQLRSLEDQRSPAMARLNASLNRPPEAVLPWPKTAVYEPLGTSDDQVIAWISEFSPDLKAMDDETAAMRRAVDLAEKDYYPDFMLGVGYMREQMSDDGGRNGVKVMAGITLPIWRQKYAAGVREAEARHRSAVQARADRANTLASMAKETLYQIRDADRKIDLYGSTLVPKAQESFQATETSFRAGTSSFTDLVDAERLELEFRLAHQRALADHAIRLAELESLVGREIPRQPDRLRLSRQPGAAEAAPAEAVPESPGMSSPGFGPGNESPGPHPGASTGAPGVEGTPPAEEQAPTETAPPAEPAAPEVPKFEMEPPNPNPEPLKGDQT